ncbi:MAG: DUF1365 family protein [Gammaproteobacteria bacterium]
MSDLEKEVSQSAIYRGRIRHRRFLPVLHDFCYDISMVMLDLDCLEKELSVFPILSPKLPSLGWFRLHDYVGMTDSCTDLKKFILDKVSEQLGHRPTGKVLLLTHLRYWGFMMNPLAIFYCYDQNNRLHSVALQVTNTPWKEKIVYVLAASRSSNKSSRRFKKNMHVSPFNPMDMDYVCKFGNPGKNLVFHLENHTEDRCHTDATIIFKRSTYSRSKLVRLALSQPAMTLKVGFGIYWQALQLWKIKSKFYKHPHAKGNQPLVSPESTN